MPRTRAAEPGVMSGTLAQEVAECGLEEFKEESTGDCDTDMEPGDAVLESAPESERWDPVPGSKGHKVPAAPSDDEDEDGRSDSERLVEEGIARAEDDQMLQATKEAFKRDKREP